MLDPDQLFDILDLDADDLLHRSELQQAALAHGWHWHEAPLYALLDRLTVDAPLDRAGFARLIRKLERDPLGPYGQVLCDLAPVRAPSRDATGGTARLFIDLQKAFTEGVWAQSIGPDALEQTAPIAEAFDRCCRQLTTLAPPGPTMFTRCPFPPDSYAWNRRVAAVMDPHQPYFIQPGNSALWPPTNGCAAWLEACVRQGCRRLVIGGCTLTSCVRVTAVETATRLSGRLEVVVDLSLCGARAENYLPSSKFGGISPVEQALREMRDAGVRVVPRVEWPPCS
jgi:hypothetical protein